MSTEPAEALAEQHRQAQLAVRARALRDYAVLWPLWKAVDDDRSFAQLVAATRLLVRAYHRVSASVSASYFQASRAAAGAAGKAAPSIAGALPDGQIVKSMYVTGRVAADDAIARGRSAAQAREDALVRTSGAVSRLVLNGGRQTLLQSVQNDPAAVGWARITDGDPCYFCLTLASRGAVYKTEETAGFEAHDHCGCTAMPLFKGTALPASTARWREIYDRAQREGEASGLLQRGENTPKARLNAVRRLLAAEGHTV